MHKHLQSFRLLRTVGRYWLVALVLLLTLNVYAEGIAVSTSGSDTWQEEVLLHDGQKMLIERSQSYGGSHEIGQDVPVADHTVRFTVPKGQQFIVWNSPFDREIGRTSLHLLAVHVKDGVAYVVTEPNLSLSYMKWGCPNPPYVLFQWHANGWHRIDMDKLPTEFNVMNVSRYVTRTWARDRNGATLSASQIQDGNATNQPQYRSIQREPLANIAEECPQMVSNGKGTWIGVGWFRRQSSLGACLDYCTSEKFDKDTCPCKQFFK